MKILNIKERGIKILLDFLEDPRVMKGALTFAEKFKTEFIRKQAQEFLDKNQVHFPKSPGKP